MSVLIKGAEMPTNCMGCPYEIYANCIIYQALSARDYSDCRHPDCPLVEIPPHGRLIDADKLMKPFYDLLEKDEHRLDYYSVGYGGLNAMIDEAPTVLESEEQEHE